MPSGVRLLSARERTRARGGGRRWRMMPVLAAALLCAGTASCAGPGNAGRADVAPDDAEWSMEGVIAGVETGPGATRVTVDVSSPEAGRAVLLVSSGTEIEVRRADGSTARGTAADLSVGARIQARHAGAEMRSLPPQYQATHVRIVPPS